MFAGDFADAVAFADREGIGGGERRRFRDVARDMSRDVSRRRRRARGGGVREGRERGRGRRGRVQGRVQAQVEGTGPGDAELRDARKKLEAARELERLEDLRAFARDQTARRAEGNALFKAGKYAEASAAYTAAVAAASSHPLASATTATTLCNRAATAHAEGRLVDALADCGRALALNPAHAKALSRRAQIHAELRLWDAAVDDLERLAAMVALATSRPSAAADAGSGADRVDAESTTTRRADAKIAARSSRVPDHTRVLGLRAGADESEARRVSKIGARAPPG